jgi:predicted transcriptional regulator
MMRKLIEGDDLVINFTNFMQDLDLNPKLVWENTRKLTDGGLVVKAGRGRYRCSEFGENGFIMMSLALKRLIDTLEDLDEL